MGLIRTGIRMSICGVCFVAGYYVNDLVEDYIGKGKDQVNVVVMQDNGMNENDLEKQLRALAKADPSKLSPIIEKLKTEASTYDNGQKQ